MTCLSAKMQRLWTISIEFLLWHKGAVHMAGSLILPRSIVTHFAVLHTAHLKNASFISGMTGVVRITRPLIETSLSISLGSSSRIFIVESSPNGSVLKLVTSASATGSGTPFAFDGTGVGAP